MSEITPHPPRAGASLSARLLVLTVFFVMVAEFLIWAPSVARFRKTWLEDHIVRAHLAVAAYAAMPAAAIGHSIERELLSNTDSYGIVLKRADRRSLMVLDDMPPKVDITVDVRDDRFFMLIRDAFVTLAQDKNSVLRVVGTVPKDPATTIEIVLDEGPLRHAMLAFSWRILTLSIVISLFTATLVYVSLQWLIVRPIRRITESMTRFRHDPEGGGTAPPSKRADEIGFAQRELQVMQDELRAALTQKTRLAALGAAVAKINHDLRNSLSTAMLVSDRLADIDDPEVKRVTPRLYSAIDRAVNLCSQTLNYVSDAAPVLFPSTFDLADLVAEAGLNLKDGEHDRPVVWENAVAPGIRLYADRDQMFRVFVNLGRNALEAGADRIRIAADTYGGRVAVDLADNGSGMSNRAMENLFQPFAGSGRKGGTGLGLPIVRDALKAHSGNIELVSTGPKGTVFRVVLPLTPAAGEAAPPPPTAARG